MLVESRKEIISFSIGVQNFPVFRIPNRNSDIGHFLYTTKYFIQIAFSHLSHIEYNVNLTILCCEHVIY